jgi:alpha-glucosidase (family GH31 glycosyl hydrolase)
MMKRKEVYSLRYLVLGEGRHYIQIVDPGIHVEPGYPPYDQAIAADLFIKNKTGQVSQTNRRCYFISVFVCSFIHSFIHSLK